MTERSSPEGPAAAPLRRRSLLASAALAIGTPVATAAAAPAPQRPEPGRLPVPQRGTAVRLVAVPHQHRDVDWLRAALQAAVEIEIATIPPYLCGWWSVKDRRSDVAQVIQRIVFDEMYHLGVVCNLLVALDGRPRIKEGAPVYPGPLPGGVHPGARVYLSGLTPSLVHDVMMAIEAPAAPLTGSVDDPLSIGVFYEEVLKTFRAVGPELSTRRQLNERIGGDQLQPVATLDDIEHAIEIVREQGEGTSSSPADAPGDDHVAHYYAFAEIYYGHRLRETDRRSFPRTRRNSFVALPRRCWPAGATTYPSARYRSTAPTRAERPHSRSATSPSSSRSGTPTFASSAATAASSVRTA